MLYYNRKVPVLLSSIKVSVRDWKQVPRSFLNYFLGEAWSTYVSNQAKAIIVYGVALVWYLKFPVSSHMWLVSGIENVHKDEKEPASKD